MKNYKFSLLGFAIVLLVASCKKEDVQQNSPKAAPATIAKGSWNSLTNWSTTKTDDSTTTYFSPILDSSINTAITNSGLVLVFRKTGNNIQSLPFKDNSTSTYWYYQISNGLLRIDANSNSANQLNFNGQTFSYFVFTSEKISFLKEQGKAETDLMQLTYDQALELSK